jgi:hypothetical protein
MQHYPFWICCTWNLSAASFRCASHLKGQIDARSLIYLQIEGRTFNGRQTLDSYRGCPGR